MHWQGHGFKKDGKKLMTKCVGEIEWRERIIGEDNSQAKLILVQFTSLLLSTASLGPDWSVPMTYSLVLLQGVRPGKQG